MLLLAGEVAFVIATMTAVDRPVRVQAEAHIIEAFTDAGVGARAGSGWRIEWVGDRTYLRAGEGLGMAHARYSEVFVKPIAEEAASTEELVWALARISLHELLHGQGCDHSRAGIMRPRFWRNETDLYRPGWTEAEIEGVRECLK
jgi:hypothetical protein